MAASAIGAELAVVHVIGSVAVPAVVVDGLDFGQGAAVTLGTSDVGVTTHQREIRLHVVIEEPRLPADRVVAGIAALVKIPVVLVIFAVTGDARAVGMGERLVSVALGTLLVGMRPE